MTPGVPERRVSQGGLPDPRREGAASRLAGAWSNRPGARRSLAVTDMKGARRTCELGSVVSLTANGLVSGAMPTVDLGAAVEAVRHFLGDKAPKVRVGGLEARLANVSGKDVPTVLNDEGIDDSALAGALAIKDLAGQINVVIHTLGILLALPYILGHDEVILSLSLGAGTGGKPYDLETNRRIAEFKFVRWRGHDGVRQTTLFADFVTLATANTEKRRELYVVGSDRPIRFLSKSKRALSDVCKSRPDIYELVTRTHGDRLKSVHEYTDTCVHLVRIIDLEAVLPRYRLAKLANIDEATT